MKKPSERFCYHNRSKKPEGFFVYVLINPVDGSVFYVGKGKSRRVAEHFSNRLLRTKNWKSNKICSINKMGEKVVVRIISNNLPETKALKYEYRLINFLIDKGIDLTNYHTSHVNHVTTDYRRKAQERAATKDIVKLFKLRFMYERIDFKDLVKQEPFCSSGVSKESMRLWIKHDNSSHDDVLPECPDARSRWVDDVAYVRVMRENGTSHNVITEILNIPLSRSNYYAMECYPEKHGIVEEINKRTEEIKNGTSKML